MSTTETTTVARILRHSLLPKKTGILVMLLLLPTVSCIALPRPETQVQKQSSRLYKALVSYFSPLGLVPIVLPSNHMPGDVMNWKTLAFEDRADSCFPTLVPQHHETTLPTVVIDRSLGGTISQNLTKILQAVTGTSGTYSVRIEYIDPYVVETTLNELRSALDRHRCGYLEPLLNEETVVDVPPLVVGRVVYAKTRIVITADAESISGLQTDVNKLLLPSQADDPGVTAPAVLDLKAAIKVKVETDHSVLVSSTTALPVALAPAFIVEAFLATRGDDEYHEVRAVSFEPDHHTDAFRANVGAFVSSDSVIEKLWLPTTAMRSQE